MIEITIPGTYSQKRHRTNGKRRYDPSAKDKKTIRQHLLQVKPSGPLEGNIRLDVFVFIQTPKSWSDKKKKEYEARFRPKRPDCDNYAKIIMDAMNGYIYNDDSQVVQLTVAKFYSEEPRTRIVLYELD